MLCTGVLVLLCDGQPKLFLALTRAFLGTSVLNVTGELDTSASMFGFACSLQR